MRSEILKTLDFSSLNFITEVFNKILEERTNIFPDKDFDEQAKKRLDRSLNSVFEREVLLDLVNKKDFDGASGFAPYSLDTLWLFDEFNEKLGFKNYMDYSSRINNISDLLMFRLANYENDDAAINSVFYQKLFNELYEVSNYGIEAYDYFSFTLFSYVVLVFYLENIRMSQLVVDGFNEKLDGEKKELFKILYNVSDLFNPKNKKFDGATKIMSNVYNIIDDYSDFTLDEFGDAFTSLNLFMILRKIILKKYDNYFDINIPFNINKDSVEEKEWGIFSNSFTFIDANGDNEHFTCSNKYNFEKMNSNLFCNILDSIHDSENDDDFDVSVMEWFKKIYELYPKIIFDPNKKDGFAKSLFFMKVKDFTKDNFIEFLELVSQYDIYLYMYQNIKKKLEKDNLKNRYLMGDFSIESNSLFNDYKKVQDGMEFEKFLVQLFEKRGYKARRIGKAGDQGADVIAEKNGIKYAIQAKFYSSVLDNTPVQEVKASLDYYGANKGIVVTNNKFTKGAVELAKANKIILIDGDKLLKIINGIDSDF